MRKELALRNLQAALTRLDQLQVETDIYLTLPPSTAVVQYEADAGYRLLATQRAALKASEVLMDGTVRLRDKVVAQAEADRRRTGAQDPVLNSQLAAIQGSFVMSGIAAIQQHFAR